MALKNSVCPHCRKENGPHSINEKAQPRLVHNHCHHCHKPYSWIFEKGKIKTFKD